jgi:peptidoglycan/xylan/chitin deacetylase (PgdA/CDA1 family)
MRDVILTVDLEYDFETYNDKNLTFVVPQLLDFFDAHGMTATFFVLGEIAEKYPELVRRIAKKHEIASHGYRHIYYDKLTLEEIDAQLSQSKRAIERLGVACKGFRVPYFIAPKSLYSLLKKNHYKYDSSLSTFFPGRYSNLFAKTKPHWTRGVLELPVPNWLWKFPPAGFSYYRFFYPLSKLFRTPYMIYLHPCEFLDHQPTNCINPLIKWVYNRNHGAKAWRLFRNLVGNSNCNFISCDEFVKKYCI